MSQDYSGYPQQPGHQQYPQQGTPPQGYPAYQQPGTPPQGYPAYQQHGYPAAPLPQAPQQQYNGASTRPGVVTSAAVLAFVQAGITAITTIMMFAGLASVSDAGADGDYAFSLVVSIAQAIGVLLLILGGVQIISGKNRGILIGAAALEIIISAAWIIRFALISTDELDGSPALDIANGAKAVMIVVALLFAIMPIITLIQSLSSNAASWAGPKPTQY
ncbi:hypothetical protein [Actinokineospora bangkokensis]|uniref:Uncharacterized protein n=1 Tax=Actinokineospora bangkokensis TaxID=1193682 RepID=A0A1Q9LIZ8_9PSEU|nr:hypothetical protein [Actinokineospora bangkokensis]OLR92008.1 hypothetical protein BJP25_24680 [Actinokineospora bangkokensis]